MFSDNLMKYIGYLEIVVGLGAALGPAVGSNLLPIFSSFDVIGVNHAYSITMYTFSLTCLFGLVLA